MKPGDLIVPTPTGVGLALEAGRVYRIKGISHDGRVFQIEDPTGEVEIEYNGFYKSRFTLLRPA